MQKFETTPYDLILLDLMMPDRPGMEVLTEIRQRDPGPAADCPNIAGGEVARPLTAGDRLRLRQLPIFDRLLPPIDLSDGIDCVEQYVQFGTATSGNPPVQVAAVDFFLELIDVLHNFSLNR
jgi:CheY-like chemotaxis protein